MTIPTMPTGFVLGCTITFLQPLTVATTLWALAWEGIYGFTCWWLWNSK